MARFIDADYLKARWGADQVERLAALGPEGTSGTAAAIDDAIAGAEAEVLALVLPRYSTTQLPATPETSPRVLKDVLADVAIYHLARPAARISDTIQRAYDRAIGFARSIARGQADIGLTDSPTVDSSVPQFLATKSLRDKVFGNGGLDEW